MAVKSDKGDTSPAIVVDGVTRVYGSRGRGVEALKNVSLDVRCGEVVGLLGPNGAGKTTLIRILSTSLLPTTGSISINGLDPVRNAIEVRKQIGVVLGGTGGLLPKLSGRQSLEYFGTLYGIPRKALRSRIDDLLRGQGLIQWGDTLVGEYSHGMRQRLHLCRVLLHDPSVLLLDEPTLGLDPISAQALRKSIREMKSLGKAILFSTHYMYEAEQVCDRLIVLCDGRVLNNGTPFQLSSRLSGLGVLEVSLPLEATGLVSKLRALESVSASSESIEPTIHRVRLHSWDIDGLEKTVVETLGQGDHEPLELLRQAPTLEDVYVELISSAISQPS